MASFRETLASLAQEGDDYVIDAPEEWAQGRTLYGGMQGALAHEAVKRAHGDLGPLRSAQFGFVGPAAGRLRFRSEILRRGRSSAIVSAECLSEEGVAARGMFVFGAARESAIAHDFAPRFEAPPPDACAPYHKNTKPLPGFLGQFEFRLASGARLFETDKQPEFAVWARFRDDVGDDAVTAQLAMGDATPAAVLVSCAKLAPVSTMTWQIDFRQPVAPLNGWRLLWTSSESAADGYSMQNMRIYDERGVTVASGRQVVAIFA
jgi:acyl-CoA thioesterase